MRSTLLAMTLALATTSCVSARGGRVVHPPSDTQLQNDGTPAAQQQLEEKYLVERSWNSVRIGRAIRARSVTGVPDDVNAYVGSNPDAAAELPPWWLKSLAPFAGVAGHAIASVVGTAMFLGAVAVAAWTLLFLRQADPVTYNTELGTQPWRPTPLRMVAWGITAIMGGVLLALVVPFMAAQVVGVVEVYRRVNAAVDVFNQRTRARIHAPAAAETPAEPKP